MKRVVVVLVLVLLVAVGAYVVSRSNDPATPSSPATPSTASKPTVSLYLGIPQGVFVPVSAIMDKFQEAHPEVEFETLVDTPEAMADVIRKNKEKPDIFISPGGHEAVVMCEEGYMDPDSLVAVGSYDLALLVPANNPGGITKLEDLLSPKVKTISFSDPDLNAACYAARMAFQNLGLWEKIRPKIEVTGCCMSSFKWITDGRAEANIQFVGCPIDPKAEKVDDAKVKLAATFPRNTLYVPRTVAGMLKTTKHPELCQEFLKLMGEPESIKLMIEKKLRNDQELPAVSGTWGPENEKSPMAGGASGAAE